MQEEVAKTSGPYFNAPDRYKAESYLKEAIEKYQSSASKLASWMEENIPEGLTVFSFPPAHRRQIRTDNNLERLNKEIKRRTRVVALFPNEASCLRLISAILMETSDTWETGRIYLNFEPIAVVVAVDMWVELATSTYPQLFCTLTKLL